MSDDPIIVVGAGQAGLQVTDSLRRGGYNGDLLLVGDEPSLPYQRPPLSKQYMVGELTDERLLFRPADFFEKRKVAMITGARVTDLDLASQAISIDGKTHKYRKLALTTGASVRRIPIPGADNDGVHYLRGLEDARALRASLAGERCRIVAIGGGFIGLELAAAARELGHTVTVVEAQDRLMGRVVAPLVSDYFLNLHRNHGVDVVLNEGVTRIDKQTLGSLNVVLSDAREVEADVVVVGIGSIPNCALAEAAGLRCENGIVVDEFSQTSDPFVVAAGDCTMHTNARLGVRHRLESVQNAVDQAKNAAATLLDERKPYDQIPWFWSDQFDAKLQMVGTSVGYEKVILRGTIAAAAFSCFYFRGRELLGVDSVNRPADHLVSRKLMAARVAVPEYLITDLERSLKSLL